MPIVLPDGFEYVGAALVSTAWLLLGQSLTVGRYRKRASIPYPQMYAEKTQAAASEDAHLFNCAQRAHQNTLEYMPIIWVSTLASGIKYPTFAAISCATWVLSRIFFTRGYLSGDPAKRGAGLSKLGILSSVGLFLTGTFVSFSSVYSKLI